MEWAIAAALAMAESGADIVEIPLPSSDPLIDGPVIQEALTMLPNLDHRGAKGSDPDTGDRAGILTQIPDAFFRAACGFSLPAPGTPRP